MTVTPIALPWKARTAPPPAGMFVRMDPPEQTALDAQADPEHIAQAYATLQGLGQQLARVELRIAFPALFDRFPGLRLAVPAQEIAMKDDSAFFGVKRLPVEW